MFITSTVFVVEGKTDQALVRGLIEAYVVITDGSNVPRETIDHLIALEKYHKIVVIEDPDQTGKRISNKVSTALNNAVTITISKKDILKKGKIGVAESDPKKLKRLIEQHVTPPFVTTSDITFNDLYGLGLQGTGSKLLIDKLLNKLPLMRSSLKGILQQLHLLNISMHEVKRALYE